MERGKVESRGTERGRKEEVERERKGEDGKGEDGQGDGERRKGEGCGGRIWRERREEEGQ